MSSKTIKAYGTDLHQFQVFIASYVGSESIGNITRDTLGVYLQQISGIYKTRSYRRKIASLNAFLNCLEREDTIPANPLRKVCVLIRPAQELPRTVSKKDIKKLLKYVYGLKHRYAAERKGGHSCVIRDIAILELLFATGIRVSEAVGLQVADVDMQQRVVRIRGKGNRERIVPLCTDAAHAALTEYARLRLSGVNRLDAFFLNRLGRRLSDQSVRNMLRKHAGDAGIRAHITPHMLRHTVATQLLENGVDIRYIQGLLGHRSITTTQIYAHIARGAQSRILRANHPRRYLQVA